MADDIDRKDDSRRETTEPPRASNERSVAGLPWWDYRRGNGAGGHR